MLILKKRHKQISRIIILQGLCFIFKDKDEYNNLMEDNAYEHKDDNN